MSFGVFFPRHPDPEERRGRIYVVILLLLTFCLDAKSNKKIKSLRNLAVSLFFTLGGRTRLPEAVVV